MKLVSKFFLMAMIAILLSNFSCAQNNKGEKKVESTDNSKNPHYVITVKCKGENWGTIELELFPEVAPKHVHNFDSLVAAKFYDGCAFHRVIPNFMIQGGDPNSKEGPKNTWGYGAPGQTKVPAEFSKLPHKRGALSAARSQDPNSASSQFFIVHNEASFLDGQYTIYGQAISGLELVDKIVNYPRDSKDNPNDKIEMYIVKK